MGARMVEVQGVVVGGSLEVGLCSLEDYMAGAGSRR